jgi:hypothetical protein
MTAEVTSLSLDLPSERRESLAQNQRLMPEEVSPRKGAPRAGESVDNSRPYLQYARKRSCTVKTFSPELNISEVDKPSKFLGRRRESAEA